MAGIAQGLGADVDPQVVDDFTFGALLDSLLKDSSSPIHGRDRDEIARAVMVASPRGPERMLDLMLRTGPYGDGFGANPKGISLATLRDNPHGIDFGPLEPRIPEVLRTESGKIELAPEPMLADLPRLETFMGAEPSDEMMLVGRRHVRSNNSWMHNIEVLVKGKPRCTLQMHPLDAERFGVASGGLARVTSRVGSVVATVDVTSDIRQNVVSLPHGWGHEVDGVQLDVARRYAGVNSNVLTDHDQMDPLSGNAVLNGIPVRVEVVRS